MPTSVTKVDKKRCNGCKRCYDMCPEDVYAWDDKEKKPVVAYPEECWTCGICWAECPKRAIDFILPASMW